MNVEDRGRAGRYRLKSWPEAGVYLAIAFVLALTAMISLDRVAEKHARVSREAIEAHGVGVPAIAIRQRITRNHEYRRVTLEYHDEGTRYESTVFCPPELDECDRACLAPCSPRRS